MPTDRVRRLVVAGLGHVGLGVIRDAVVAGYRTVGLGPESAHVVRLIDGLAAEDAIATALSGAIADGRCRITGDPAVAASFDVAVIVPGGRPVDPADTGEVERITVALSPHLRSGALIVIGGVERPSAHGELLAATVELLTGLRAGHEYDLGFAIAPVRSNPSDPTIVSGVDGRAARRTAALHRQLGRPAGIVVPARAAEFVALLQPRRPRVQPRPGSVRRPTCRSAAGRSSPTGRWS
jgi:UDP-N-acetyl-D-mannosaminuronate dehydrogenase